MSKFLNFAWEQRNKLRAEGDKLWAEGDRLWAEAVIIKYGPKTTIEWNTDGCIVNGDKEFKYPE